MDEKELENFRQVIQGLTQDLANLGSVIGDSAGKTSKAATANEKSFNGMTDAINKGRKAEEEYTQSKKNALKGMQDFAKSVGVAAMSTETGMTKYSAGLQKAGDAIGEFVGHFGILGKATEYLIKGFTMAADAVMKQNDAIFKSYDELGKFGVTLGTSTEDVLQLGIKAGYSSKNLESLYKSAKSLDSGLVALGGSTSGGVKAFAEIANVGEEARNNFRALGYSQEEVTEIQADYVKKLAQTGGTLAKTPRQLSEESQKYITNLTALAELTGKSVKEQQKAQEVALQQRNLNAFVNNLEEKRAKAVANGNEVEAKRLESQIASTKAYAAHVVATEDAETAAAKLESLSTDNAVIMTKNNANLASMGYNFDKVNEALRRGESPMKMYFLNAEENSKVQTRAKEMFGENLYRLGETSVGLQKFTNQSNEARSAQAAYNKYLTLSEEERKKVDNMTSEEAIKYLTREKAQNDERNELRNKQLEAEKEFRQAMDQLTTMLGKMVMPVLKIFADILLVVAKSIKGLVEIVHTMGDGFDRVKDMFDDFVMGLRENPVTRKLFGLTAVSADERNAYNEKRAVTIAEREKAIAERRALNAPPVTAGPAVSPATQAQAQRLPATANAGGFDMDRYLQSTALVESGGNRMAKAGTSSASGLFQFTEGTWNQMTKEMGKQYSLDDRFDPKKSAEVMAYFTQRQKSQLEKGTGKEASSVDLYMAHFLGASGATKFINAMQSNPNSVAAELDPKAAQANKNIYYDRDGRPRSVAEVYNLMASKIGKAEQAVDTGKWGGKAISQDVAALSAPKTQVPQAAFGGIFSGPATGYPVTLHGTEVVIPDFKIADFNQSLKNTTKQELPTSASISPSPAADNAISDLMNQLYEMMESKLSELINAVETGNNTSDKILQYSRV